MIEGERINLRTYKEKDLEEYLEHVSKLNKIGEFWPTRLQTETQLHDQYAKTGFWGDEWGSMLITDKQDKMLGQLNYFPGGLVTTTGYELGYRIFRPRDRKKGYVSEALPLIISYLFDLKPINRLQVCCDVGNIGSKKIAEKTGFKFEGIMRGSYYLHSKFCDIEIYSLLRSEWEKL
jgi:RimJ/RimL family protein N-acetyltransferase